MRRIVCRRAARNRDFRRYMSQIGADFLLETGLGSKNPWDGWANPWDGNRNPWDGVAARPDGRTKISLF